VAIDLNITNHDIGRLFRRADGQDMRVVWVLPMRKKRHHYPVLAVDEFSGKTAYYLTTGETGVPGTEFMHLVAREDSISDKDKKWIEKARHRAESATDHGWGMRASNGKLCPKGWTIIEDGSGKEENDIAYAVDYKDAMFISHARKDVLDLIAEVEYHLNLADKDYRFTDERGKVIE
jgi:hypothetical protein